MFGGLLGNLLVNITGNASQLLQQLGITQARVKAFGASIVGAGKSIGSAFAASLGAATGAIGAMGGALGRLASSVLSHIPLARWFAESIQNASDLESAMRRLERTFGSAAPAIAASIDRMTQAFAAPKQELASLAATAGRTFEGMGVSAARAAEMTKAILARSLDIAADGTMGQADAMKALIASVEHGGGGLGGIGAQMTDAEIHTKALAMGFVRANGVITKAEEALVRFAVAMEGTKSVEGAAAERMDAFGGATVRVSAAFANLSAEVGTVFLPYMAKLVDILGSAIERMTSLVKAAKEFAELNANLFVGWAMGVDPDEIAKILADNRKLNQPDADKANAGRNAQLQRDQQAWLFHRGASRSSLGDFAKTLQAAGLRQRNVGEQQLDQLKQINGVVQRAAGKIPANPGANAVKPGGAPN